MAKSGSVELDVNYTEPNKGSTIVQGEGRHAATLTENWCAWCKVQKPLRAKHCHTCNACVIKFDHHCPIIGNCIGARNHFLFWLYVTAELIFTVWSFVLNWTAYPSAAKAVGWFVCYWVVFCASGFFAIFVGAMFSFHSYLALTGQTTYEIIKRDADQLRRDLNAGGKKGLNHAPRALPGRDIGFSRSQFSPGPLEGPERGTFENLRMFVMGEVLREWV